MKTLKQILLATILTFFGTLDGNAQWVKDNTIEGGIINTFTVSGSNLFAGTSGGGVYISSNNGASWTGVNSGLPDYGLVAALFASGPNILASIGSKLYVTLNNGVSWSEVTSGLPAFSSITSFTNNGTGTFAAGSVGVFLSTDNGINWVSVNTGLPGSPSINSIVASGTNLFVAGSGGVYFSGDSGSNWSPVNNTSFVTGAPTFNTVKSLAVSGSNLFAGTAKLGVFLSTDNGANWSAVNSGLASSDINALAISGTNLFAGTNDIGSVFTSSNNGATWSAANTGLNPNTIVRAFAINGSNLFAGTWAGVAVSANNGASWTNTNAGLNASAIFALEFIGSNLFAGTAGGIFRSTNNGVSWTPVNSGLSNTNIQCLTTNGTSLLAGTVGGGGGVFQSNDNGASWSSINNGILIGTLQDIRSLSADGVNYFAGGGDGRIFRSTDSGGNWAQVFATNTIHGLKAIGNNIFAARQGVRVSRSIDNGSSWSDANSGIVPASGSTYGFAATATELYVAADFGVYLSTNLGLTWTRPGLPGFAPQFLRSVVASGPNVFAGSDFNGIYFSSDKGSNWSTESFPQLRVRALAISGTTVFAGTQGQGIWSRALSSPPTITSFTPGNGPIGTTVTITGTNFDPTPANNIVKFNGTTAVVTASTATSISTSVPAGATTGTITVTVAGITATSVTNFTVTQNFITQWNLATPGSGPTQLSFGTATSGTVIYTWQEISPGSATGSGSWSGSTLTITGLPTGATIRLQIAPTNFQRIILDNGTDRNRLRQVEQWGSTAWTSMQNAFYGCANLQITATDVPDLSGVGSMASMFLECTNLNSPSNINTWNTAAITNMSLMFAGARTFNQDIGAWNTAAVTNMNFMFNQASAFNRGIGTWNTGAVSNMSSMFSGASSFNQNIGAWNTGAVTDMGQMFYFASAFDQNIGMWNAAAVTDMNRMFYAAVEFNNGGDGSINNWNTSAVTKMNEMFFAASAFNQNIGAWNTGAVTTMNQMFAGAVAFNQNIGGWNTSAVTNMGSMFSEVIAFNQDIGAWNTGAVTDMSGMFFGARAFNKNIGSWNTSAVTNMNAMFWEANAFNQDIGSWNTAAVDNMDGMFSGANSFNQDIGGWNTGAVINMGLMFVGANVFNQDIGAWNTAAVTDMELMFANAPAFNQNIGAWTLNPGVNLINTFSNSGMDCNNYSATLIGWNTNPTTPNGRTLGAIGRQYGTNAVAARTNLTTTKGWTITGDTPSGAVCTPPVPTIVSFSPVSGIVGRIVTITGTNFSTILANNIVKFNGVVAVPTDATATTLTALVPTGATTGLITVMVGAETAVSAATFSVVNNFGNLDFTPRVDYSMSAGTALLKEADLNGDKIKDIIVPNGPNVAILLGSSSGNFNAQSITIGGLVVGFVAKDLNGDNIPDLALANNASQKVDIRLGNGDGTFAIASSYFIGLDPQRMVSGDFNNDGKEDLAVTYFNGVSILLGTGAGTFNPPVSYTTTNYNIDLVAKDFNNDGKLDLAISNQSNQSLLILAGGGDGSFAIIQTIANVSSGPVISEDINYDGINDLVAGGPTNKLNIMLGTGTGSFNAPTSITADTPIPVARDFNGDNKLDLALASYNNGVISIFLNNGTGNFTFSQSFAVTVNPIEFVLSDFNHDNLLDVATTSLTSTNIGVLLGVSSTIAITSFSPTSGPIGTTVTITGINFDPTPANNIVNFNGTTAVVTASTATSISTSVPAGATTGPVTVTVGGNTATSATDFTVTASCIPLSERAALIAFYNATNGDSWASNENWLGPDESTWLGVSVTGCHVTGIAIQNNNLNGSLPVELGDLSELTNLSITLNSNLTGSIPSTLGNLSELTSLDLWNNHLTGSIPASLGNLSSLVTLQLMNNNLSGSIPSQLGTLPVIHDIRLDGNQLSGTLPASLFNLATLKNLELGSNQLSGPLSPSFANLTNLEGLGLNGNMFSGPIPTELGSLIKLIRLQLAVNQLTGTLPASIGNLVNLRDFSVFNNQLTGTVPASFANLVNLTGLGLSVNQFTGDVPAGIGLIPNLNGVSLRDNDFTSIPTFVSTSFTDLRVHGNKLNFGHLEPNISKGGFVYAPQDNLPGGIASACAGGALTINFSTPGTANSYQWYKGGVLIPGATSANFTKPNATVADAGNYTVRVTNSIVTGLILQSDNFVVTINAVVAPGITGDAACAGTTAILTASGSTNGNYRWYTTPTGGTPLSGEVNSSYTTPVLSATTTYYVSISTGSCESARTAVTATVNPLPAAPSSPVNGSSCGAGTVALSVSGGTNGQYRWYNTPTGGNAIPGEVNSAYTTPSISATTIYYAAINNGTCESTRTPVTATTNPIPTAPTLPVNGSSCGAGTVTISVSGGTNGQYRWYTAAIGGIALPGEVNGSYTAPSLSVTTTYYATLSISGCESATRTPVTATISSIPTAPTSPVNGSSCGAGTVTVSVSGGTTGQYRWYTALNGGTPIPGETNSSYTTPSISAPTNYYAAINNGTCESTRTLVTATIYPIPTAPTLPVNGSSCGAGTVTVSVSGGTTGQYRWYTALNGGTPIPGETNSSYTTPSISAPTSYYAAINNGTCESTRTSVTANVINTPAPTTTGSSICPGSTVTLTATGGANGQYKWYAVATGGTPITGAVNGSFTTAALSITTTFYVTITANGCESARTPVTATVNTSGCAPSIPAQTYNLPIEGKVEVDLKQLITTSGILDVNTIKIIKQPASGASASIVNGVLIIDYKGKPFVGREIIIIEACTTTGQCSQQTFEIDVAGDIVVFNGISPNGDGLNDFLTIQNIELLPETKNNTVMIYSRWGDEVFKVSDYNNADRVFKGETNNGSKLPAGTYFYKIVLPDADKTMTGFISIKH